MGPGARTLYSSGGIRVFDGYAIPDGRYTFVACLSTAGTLRGLDPPDFFVSPTFVSAGAFLAYAVGQDDFEGRWAVRVMDLRTGRYAHVRDFLSTATGRITGLVVRARGSISWIETNDDLDTSDSTVRIADSRGQRIPRGGKHVREGSLRLYGARLSWRKGAKTYRALLL